MFDTVVHWFLIAYLIIVPTFVVLRYRRAALATTLILCGAVALLFTRLPDISSFKLLGMQATLESQIGKVQVTIDQLQKLAAAMAKGNLSELAMSGQLLSRMNTDAKFSIRDDIVNSLKTIGVSDDQIHDAQVTWINVYANMLLSQIVGEATKTLPSALDEIDKLPRYADYDLPDPTTVDSWAKSRSLSSPRMIELVAEYARLWTTGSMKDPTIIPFNASLRTRPNN